MARQNLPAITGATGFGSFPGPYPDLPIGAGDRELTRTNTSDTEWSVPLTNNKTCIFAYNSHATDPFTITFLSVIDERNRVGDIPAGETHFFGPFATIGWAHTGNLWIDTSNEDIRLSAVNLP